jgi:hypothetical protein
VGPPAVAVAPVERELASAATPRPRESSASTVSRTTEAQVPSAQPTAQGIGSIGAAAPAAASPGTSAASAGSESRIIREGISVGDVKRAIEVVRPQIAECYEQALKLQPDLAGRVVVEFELSAADGGGQVVSGQVPETETHSPFFEACVLARVRGAKFPSPEGDGHVKVRYPFQFDPGGGFGGGSTP